MKTPKKKNQLNKYIKFSGMGLQLGLTIYVAAYLGGKLDAHYQNEKKIYTILFVLVAFVGTMFSLVSQLNKMNDN